MQADRKTFTVAIEGCCHGELDNIYATLQHLERVEGRKVDLLICCGDFQAVRNLDDLETMAVPQKHRHMMTFWKYYSGQAVAPVPTLFIGGNHEAPNYLSELFYGGWAAPNIYFLGQAGAVRFGGRRIAGISGTWSSAHYRMGHYERPPYNPSSMRSAYHVKELQVFRLMQLRRPVDVFLSHDWPQWITHYGDRQDLFRRKPYFQAEAERGDLGSPPLLDLLHALQPAHWFSAHLHCKFAALVPHPNGARGGARPPPPPPEAPTPAAAASGGGAAAPGDGAPAAARQATGSVADAGGRGREGGGGGDGGDAAPRATRFLALDKCLPGRDFLQVVELEATGPLVLEYDEEWLAVVRSTAHLMATSRTGPALPRDWGGRAGARPEDVEFVRGALAAAGGAAIPHNFVPTAPAYSPAAGQRGGSMPRGLLPNPQTQALLRMLGLPEQWEQASPAAPSATGSAAHVNPEEIQLSDGEEAEAVTTGAAAANPEEIPLDMDDADAVEDDPMFAPLDLPNPYSQA